MAEERDEQQEPRCSSHECKLEAVRLSETSEQTVAQMARDRGVPERVLSRWRHQLREQPVPAFPGKGPQSALRVPSKKRTAA